MQHLGAELWERWAHLGISVRSYAQQEAIHPGSVSRYFNGGVLPAEEFVLDLVDESERLRELLRAAQETQSSNWGATKRWKSMEHKQRARAERPTAGDNELAATRERLRLAESRIVILEQECASLRASLDGSPGPSGEHLYWRFYAGSLAARGWSSEAIGTVDSDTNQVVDQLADPAAPDPTPRRGTVIHYPGSGRKANLVGLVAKSIGLGYRLVIVLAGNLNAVRRRVQRDIDDGLPWGQTVPTIYRLTTQETDYRTLAQSLFALEFEKRHPELPLNAPENLRDASVRLVVVKKNRMVLRTICVRSEPPSTRSPH